MILVFYMGVILTITIISVLFQQFRKLKFTVVLCSVFAAELLGAASVSADR